MTYTRKADIPALAFEGLTLCWSENPLSGFLVVLSEGFSQWMGSADRQVEYLDGRLPVYPCPAHRVALKQEPQLSDIQGIYFSRDVITGNQNTGDCVCACWRPPLLVS